MLKGMVEKATGDKSAEGQQVQQGQPGGGGERPGLYACVHAHNPSLAVPRAMWIPFSIGFVRLVHLIISMLVPPTTGTNFSDGIDASDIKGIMGGKGRALLYRNDRPARTEAETGHLHVQSSQLIHATVGAAQGAST